MNMRFQVSKPVLSGREVEYATDAVSSGWISGAGPYLDKFQRRLAEIIGLEECLAVSSGTTALHLACLALELLPGQEVIVPAMTFVASANCVRYCGAEPVFVDSDPVTWNMTAESIEAAITPKTVGVIFVHLYGSPAGIEEAAELCARRGLWLIEDCAESLGASLHGKMTGTFGDAATFSFFGNKTISTGEGGAVALRDPMGQRQARLLRGQGMDAERRYWHAMIGYNYRMTNVAAAIGLGQLEQFDYHVGERKRVAAGYIRHLDGAVKAGLLRVPVLPTGADGSYWLFTVLIANCSAARREAIEQVLKTRHGIETRPFFVPLPLLPMYQRAERYCVAEALGRQGLCLPTYSGLDEEAIEFIAEKLVEVIASGEDFVD